MIQLIRGFKDILPDETQTWRHIEDTAIALFQSFGFKEIRLPIVEKTELFQRSIGEHTDIVEKEMYTFAGSKGELITLRPEATASVVRSYIQQKLYAKEPIQKLYTIGPMFRRERPQKGRYRQFYQINAEVFGIESPYIDAQLIFMLWTVFMRLEITGLSVQLNSLGCPACRPSFKEALASHLASKTGSLCSDCVRRQDKNPLRVLDCKVPSCQEVIDDAPSMVDYLCDDCARHFNAVQSGLASQGIPFELNPRLVRGLDYYTRTAFEIQTDALGAQNAIAGGGRYDMLVKMLGGPEQPAIGFAIGLDRLVALVMQGLAQKELTPDIFIAALGEKVREKTFEWSCALGQEGIRTEIDFSDKSLKALMKRANRIGAANVLIVGTQEIEEGAVLLRNMQTKEQVTIPIEGMVNHIKKHLT
ncbi:MAG: histidine--tRNA ligase [Desulfobacteraceae bacterium]|nr:histidine--tRNA ligase [Desulfobacteraceae bacterium]MBC2757183.1 histidine--tRNA ligase [Desulfobacteraceae bacterium]